MDEQHWKHSFIRKYDMYNFPILQQTPIIRQQKLLHEAKLLPSVFLFLEREKK